MLVDIRTYLAALFNNVIHYKDLITIDHKIGMIKYIFSTQSVDIKPLDDQLKKYISPDYYDTKEHIMLMNKELGNKININDVVFKDVEKMTIINGNNSYVIYNTPIKVKDLLVALHHTMHKDDTSVEIRNIHEVPFTNELIMGVYTER
jgi:hypothetical protein